ncbi:MAG: MATE family efflux transporter [Firmicutes bacterium]|nr:MATE family efflux transporter [Bacillota bacterium]
MMKDMTEGNVSKTLIMFTLPMLLSVMFQQFYNMADSMIVGKFVGEAALGAVGSSYTITMIFVAIAVGSNSGCAVVISHLFGNKNYVDMKTTINTVFITAAILSIALTAIGLMFYIPVMDMIKTPADVYNDAMTYLRIYIYGLTFLIIYNVSNGIYTALGDSRTPLVFLICSSVGNIFLDLYFVISLKMGVAGAAWATFITQGIASVLSFITLTIKLKKIKPEEKPKLFSFRQLKSVCFVAIPSILQQSFVSVGNMFIQSLVNSFGSAVLAGYSSAIKINTFAITSFTSLGSSMSSFTAQNMGAGKPERVKEGYRAGNKIAIISALVCSFIFLFFGKSILMLFLNNESALALDTGIRFLRIVSPFYIVITLKLIADGVLKGSKAMGCFMFATFFDLIIRVILAYTFALGLDLGATGIWLSWPIGWALATAMSVCFYLKGVWLKKYNLQHN